jgi:hypothetical protein
VLVENLETLATINEIFTVCMSNPFDFLLEIVDGRRGTTWYYVHGLQQSSNSNCGRPVTDKEVINDAQLRQEPSKLENIVANIYVCRVIWEKQHDVLREEERRWWVNPPS